MRVLFVLSQRPELTGSGITVDSLVREASTAGHEAWVLCGVPAGGPAPRVGGLPGSRIRTVTFGDGGRLPFPVPGMSDVMPYASTVWSIMTGDQLDQYREVWTEALAAVADACRPDVVHTNHLWLVSALASAALPNVPIVAHCHATGLRQMALCPHIRNTILPRLGELDAVLVSHRGHVDEVSTLLGLPVDRVHVVGAGYREDVFHQRGAARSANRRDQLLYVGKYAAAKGCPWLLDACELLWRSGSTFTLHVAGDGSGTEADALRERMTALAPRVVQHGRLDQPGLADLMRRMAVLVLPSLYEGLPLVLAEARACGCGLVSTALAGVVDELAPVFGDSLHLVEPPRLTGPDTPVATDLPDFVERLAGALSTVLATEANPPDAAQLAPLTWAAVYGRVAGVWEAARR